MADDQWAFMHEWWVALTDMSRLQLPVTPRRGSQQFAFRAMRVVAPQGYFSTAKSLWTQQRDALELVFLQRTLDERSFMAMARRFCRHTGVVGIEWGDFHSEEVIPRLVDVHLGDLHNLGKNGMWAMTLLTMILNPVALKDRTKGFKDARTKILAMADERTRQEMTSTEWTIPVNVGLLFSSESYLAGALKHIAQLKHTANTVMEPATDKKEERRRAALRVYPFHAAYIDVSFAGVQNPQLLSDALLHVGNADGLQLRDVKYHPTQGDPSPMFGNVIHELMVKASSSEDTPPIDASLELFSARSAEATSADVLAQFMSALSECRFNSVTVGRVLDQMDATERRVAWLWIIHGLFSPTASRSITTVSITTSEVRDEDIAVARSYVEAKNPIALLCHPAWRLVDAYDPETQPRKRVLVAKGVSLILCQSSAQQAQSVPLHTRGFFDVIQENDEFVDVVVPAYAQCRVRKADVTQWQELPTASSSLIEHSIKSLQLVKVPATWSATDVHHTDVVAFLELVGQPLESLDLLCQTERPDVFLDAVWRACPNLMMLRMKQSRLLSLDNIIDAFETNKCRVESLQLTGCSIEDRESRVRFFQALEGPGSRTSIAAKLRELSFSNDRFFFITVEEMEAIAASLRTSQRLHYIAIGGLGDNRDKLRRVFHALDGESLRDKSGLWIRQKCALLSVIELASNATDGVSVPSAHQVAQLDSPVLSKILAFAARPIKRSMVLKS